MQESIDNDDIYELEECDYLQSLTNEEYYCQLFGYIEPSFEW